MDESTRIRRPGEKIPASGIYECTCGQGHRFTSTDVQGHSFPPVPQVGWNLLMPAYAERSL